MTLTVNGRYRRQSMSGIQRVSHEIESRLTLDHRVLEPSRAGGLYGHLWEQSILPLAAAGGLIWGPGNTGPLLSRHQVLTIHGAGVFDHPEWFSPNFVRLHTTLWPMLARRVHCITTVSRFSQRRLSEVLGLPLDEIRVVPNGVDEKFRPATDAEIAAAKIRVGLSPEQPFFATLSTLEPRKNLSLVLDAFEQARARLPRGATLLVIGAAGDRTIFKADTASMKGTNVVALGRIDDETLVPLLSGACGVLYPSLYEGFGLPILEAMASGAPAVTTALASLPEVGGDAAIYVDPFDAKALAKVMIALADSSELRGAHAQMGLEHVRPFTWDRSARMTQEILEQYV